MPDSLQRRSKKAGLPPGALLHVGEKKVQAVTLTLQAYGADYHLEKEVASIEGALQGERAAAVRWLNVAGLHDVDVLEQIGQRFGIHPLVLEDILNTGQRPKVDDLGEYVFIVLKRLRRNEAAARVQAEQVSLIFGSDFVLSFEERPDDLFAPLRERIRNARGRIRQLGPDYLAYALVDTVVDHYFTVLEHLADEIDALEERLLEYPTPTASHQLNRLRRTVLVVRRSIWPLREVVGEVGRSESPLVQAGTGPYWRDVHDHAVEMMDTVETFREMIAGMLDMYLSSLTHRTNEVMKVLTLIATIFIPLTFITGVYGMNFDTTASPWNMPELRWYWGYPAALALMAAVVGAMLLYFRRKRWL